MEIKPQDYIHLYLGCDVSNGIEVGKLVGVTESEYERGKTIALIDFGADSFIEWYAEETKPILRKLSDMTEEEAMMVCRMQIKGLRECDRINITVMKPIVKFRIYTDGEDPDHGIERFMRIEEYLPTQFTYLLKQGFDLFGLIPAGLAIDKTPKRTVVFTRT